MNASNPHTLLICSVGGTPEPIVTSLLHWKPGRVIFVVSDQTRSQVDAVLQVFAQAASGPLGPGQYSIKTVDDAEDLLRCIQSMRTLGSEVDDWIDRKNGNYRVVVDFTAGTKCMTAALALVAHRWPCLYSYIGGRQRTKGGVGVVETGTERVVYDANPWDVLGYQAIEDAVTVFNHGGFAAAAHLLDDAIKKTKKPEVKRELATLQLVIDAYAAWDRFDHKEAERRFADAIKNSNDLSAIFVDAQKLIRRIEQHKERVRKLASQPESVDGVEDLVRSAERRAAEQRFDDAVARLYRAIEALAQVRLRDRHDIANTKEVSLDRLPTTLRQEWQSRARDGKLSLGLRDAYRLLQELGDDLGTRFSRLGLDRDEGSPLFARNSSILAHGFRPASRGDYDQLRKSLDELAPFPQPQTGGWQLPSLR